MVNPSSKRLKSEIALAQKSVEFVCSTKKIKSPSDTQKKMSSGMNSVTWMHFYFQSFFFLSERIKFKFSNIL